MFLMLYQSFSQLAMVLRKLSFALFLVLLFANSAAQAELTLGVNQESYFARKEFLYGERDYTNIFGRFRYYPQGETFRMGVDAGGYFSPNVENYSAAYLPELWFSLNQKSSDVLPQEVVLGRKRMPWSVLDADWGLGIFQPLLRVDYLHPEQQGLTGLFVTWKGADASLTLFGSGLFIPEQTPTYQIENQKLISSSPWFSEPANRAILTEGQPSEILYTLHLDTNKVIFQTSLGVLFTIGQLDHGGWVKGAYAYKPNNRVPVPFTHHVEPTTEVIVDIYPRAEFHHVATFDVGYSTGNGTDTKSDFSIATLLEVPENPETESSMNRQKLDLQTMVSPSFGMHMKQAIFPELWFKTSYLYRADGRAYGEGPLVDAGASPESLFGYRLDFTNAFLLSVGAELLGSSTQRLETSFRWIEEFDQSGSLLMIEVRYYPVQNLALFVAGDFLGARVDDSDETGLITKYRGNDRVIGGISYAF